MTGAVTPALGCGCCGAEQRSHGQRWTREAGLHGWTEPTRAQIHARLRARLAAASAREPANPKEHP